MCEEKFSGILECIIFLDGLLRLSQQRAKRESMTNEAQLLCTVRCLHAVVDSIEALAACYLPTEICASMASFSELAKRARGECAQPQGRPKFEGAEINSAGMELGCSRPGGKSGLLL